MKTWRHMTIRLRIWFGYLIVISALGLAMLVQRSALGEFSDVIDGLQRGVLLPISGISEVQDRLDRLDAQMNFYLQRADYQLSDELRKLVRESENEFWAASLREQEQRIEEVGREIRGLVAAIDQWFGDFKEDGLERVPEPQRDSFPAIERMWRQHQKDTLITVDEVGSRNLQGAKVRFQVWESEQEILEGALDRFKEALRQYALTEVATTEEKSQLLNWLVPLLTLLAMAVSLSVPFWLGQSISKRLNQLNAAHKRWMQEDFDYRVEDRANDELRDLAVSANQMAERLSELDDLKRDFISHVSHELKSPLNSMLSAIRMMQLERAGEVSERQQKLLRGMQETGDRLSRSIVNLLDFSRIEAGIFAVRPAAEDLVAVLESYLDEVEPRVQESGLGLQRDVCRRPAPVLCDRSRIQQVLANFLDNAIKFSPPEAVIEVSLQCHKRRPKLPEMTFGHRPGRRQPVVVVSVSDAGPGIPSEKRGEIFSKFQQLESEHSRTGVGLGLAICRSIIEAHQGLIWAEESELGGSRFSFLLPLIPDEEQRQS
ncbi:MAG TPA: ATP-binding protein [Acidobacteriota bacterium]|nr:ATP-binding protein [Acidobacteriota bacterium]